MARINGSDSQVVETVGKGIPQKCRTQQKYDKRPGEVKIFSRAEIRGYERWLERRKKRQENVKVKRTVKMPRQMRRHCGPNFRKDYKI
ncbi:hypothetical protein N9934_01905 [Desulfosarcina sp.]|nr:hypothetical protein [Desulfosarcina sp.]